MIDNYQRLTRKELIEVAKSINSKASAEDAIEVLRSCESHLSVESAECLLELLNGDLRAPSQGPYRHICVNRAVSYISKGMDISRALAIATAEYELEKSASFITDDFQSPQSHYSV